MTTLPEAWVRCRELDLWFNRGAAPARRGFCGECARETFGDDFAISGLCRACLEPGFAAWLQGTTS